MSGPQPARSERRFPVATRALGEGLDALEAALRGAHLPEAAILDLRLVAEEVLTNVAAYGYDDTAEHSVALRLTVGGGLVTLEFRDDGRAFDPLAAAPPDLEPPLEARAPGSLGIHLIRSLVDTAAYVRAGRENVLTLTKRVEARVPSLSALGHISRTFEELRVTLRDHLLAEDAGARSRQREVFAAGHAELDRVACS